MRREISGDITTKVGFPPAFDPEVSSSWTFYLDWAFPRFAIQMSDVPVLSEIHVGSFAFQYCLLRSSMSAVCSVFFWRSNSLYFGCLKHFDSFHIRYCYYYMAIHWPLALALVIRRVISPPVPELLLVSRTSCFVVHTSMSLISRFVFGIRSWTALAAPLASLRC